MDYASLLTPSQLLRMQADTEPLAAHGSECRSCGEWLESHRALGNALHTLSAATASAGASASVEANLLRQFRAQKSEPQVVAMPEPSARRWWQLSRAFEIGAYAAVAAALIVGAFLGARILHDRQAPAQQEQANGKVTPASPKSETHATPVVAQAASQAITGKAEQPLQEVAAREVRKHRTAATVKTTGTVVDRSGYVAMMLCDPLMCSGDEQVVRMELPAAQDGSSQQTVLADVVIGSDGLIRGMRIVN